MTDRDHVREIRHSLTDPMAVVQLLGLAKDAQRNSRGVTIRCPNHDERTPSCSVTTGPDGTIRAKCFGCDWSADALGMVAQVYGLDLKSEFRSVLEMAANLAGLHEVEAEIRGDRPVEPRRPMPPAPEPVPETDYPDEAEVRALWDSAGDPATDLDAARALLARSFDPAIAYDRGLLRVLIAGADLPLWARFRGRTWSETGHRLITRVWAPDGRLRSVRSWRVGDGDSPKRLPPAGCRAHGLVLANGSAHALLTGERRKPCRVVIVEGEPDWVTWCQQTTAPVFGVLSGAWGPEFAARIPAGSEVVIRTHRDQAGDRYASQVAETLGERVAIWRAA